MKLINAFSRNGAKTYEIQMPSMIRCANTIEGFIYKLMISDNYCDDEAFQMSLAAKECMANAVEHGSHYDESKNVRLKIVSEKDKISIEIKDQSENAISIDENTEIRLPENLMAERGRGNFLVRCFTDYFSVKPYYENGTLMGNVRYLMKKKSTSGCRSGQEEPRAVSGDYCLR